MAETAQFHSAYAKKCRVVLHSSSIYKSLITFTTELSADFPNRYRRLRSQCFKMAAVHECFSYFKPFR